MSKCTDIIDFCGDYSFEVEYSENNKFRMFFNSRRNAETVKRCIEVDDSVPNVATAVDFVEVVRCKDCVYFKRSTSALFPQASVYICDNPYGLKGNVAESDYCSYGERREE